ncbi:MAG: aldo/keto reductase [Acidobacteria bacterium]|nr:aldo/keto reductase [Acidobacteriota bacterium]
MDNHRRQFLRAAAGLAALAQQALAQKNRPGGIPTRRLGRTNEQVSILALGGAHFGRAAGQDKAAAFRMLHTAIDEGVNFLDNAWMYGDGTAEEFMGEGLQGGWRKKVFLMTKNSGRDETFSKQCLEDSLRRLRTDHLDLWQFHETNYDNDPDWVFEKGGLKYALQAQQEGKVRYIGFTGHKDPRIHNKMLDKPYDWATAQMPINVMDRFYRSFQSDTVPLCLAKDVGVIGMKTLGGGPRESKIVTDTQVTAEQCVRFALSRPVSAISRGWLTMEQLQADLKIARDFQPLSAEEEAAILTLARPEAGDGRHELFKSTRVFDGPIYRKMHGLPVEGDSL